MIDLKKFMEDLKAQDFKDKAEMVKWLEANKPAVLTPEQLEAAIIDDSADRIWLLAFADRKITKGIDTWKTNNLQGEIDVAVAKAQPKETPEQKRLRDLEQSNLEREKREKRLIQENLALRKAREMNLPEALVTYFVGADEDTTLGNLKTVKDTIDAEVAKRVDEEVAKRFKAGGSQHEEAGSGGGGGGGINPWKKETFNLTEQGKLVKDDPAKAKVIAMEAGVDLVKLGIL